MAIYISSLECSFTDLCKEVASQTANLKYYFGPTSEKLFLHIFSIWETKKAVIKTRLSDITRHKMKLNKGGLTRLSYERSMDIFKTYYNFTVDSFEHKWMNIVDIFVHCAFHIGITTQSFALGRVKQFVNDWFYIREELLLLWEESFKSSIYSPTATSPQSNPHSEAVDAIFADNTKITSHYDGVAANKPGGTGYQQYPSDSVGATASVPTGTQMPGVHSSRSGSSTSPPICKSETSVKVTVTTSHAVPVYGTHSKVADALRNQPKTSAERQRSTEEEHAVSGMSEEVAVKYGRKLERLDESLQQFQPENEHLKKQLAKEQEQRENLEKSALLDRNNAQQFKEEILILSQQFKEEQEARRELEQKLRDAEKARGHAMDQLAANMDREISRDEQNYENINIRNRPLKIVEEFEGLCSQAWLTAKQAIDEFVECREIPDLSEKERCLFLCEVLEACYANAEHVLKTILTENAHRLSDDVVARSQKPLQAQPVLRGDASTEISAEELVVPVKKVLKKQAHEADFNYLPRNILKKLVNRNKRLSAYIYRHNDIETYAKEGMKLCWKMVLQQPAMTIDCKSLIGKPIDEKLAEPHYGSANPKDPRSRVDYYVNPGVFHGKRPMNKARVFLATEADRRAENPSPSSTDVYVGEAAADRLTRRPDGGVSPAGKVASHLAQGGPYQLAVNNGAAADPHTRRPRSTDVYVGEAAADPLTRRPRSTDVYVGEAAADPLTRRPDGGVSPAGNVASHLAQGGPYQLAVNTGAAADPRWPDGGVSPSGKVAGRYDHPVQRGQYQSSQFYNSG